MPTIPSSSLTALLKMLESAGGPKSHDPVPSKTTMSPRWIGRRWYTSLLTSTRSFTSRVFSIEPDGIQKAWTTKDLMTSASTSAMAISTGSSRQKLRRRRPPRPLRGCAGGSSSVPGPPAPGGPPGTGPPDEGGPDAGRPAGRGIPPRPGIAWVSVRSGTGSAGPQGGDPPSRAPEPLFLAPGSAVVAHHRERIVVVRAYRHFRAARPSGSHQVTRGTGASGLAARAPRSGAPPAPGEGGAARDGRAAADGGGRRGGNRGGRVEPGLLEGVRDGQVGEPGEGPDDQEGPADHGALRDGAVAGVAHPVAR